MTDKFKVEIEIDRWNPDDKQLRITTNGWQWTGIYLTDEQLSRIKDEIEKYISNLEVE